MISDPLCLFDYTHGERRRGRGDHHVGRAGPGSASNRRCTSWRRRTAAPAGGARRSSATSRRPTSTSRRRATARWRSGMYEMAGVGPADVDVALLYDHFSPMVLMQLEDYGFCAIGEGGPFVADGNIRWHRLDPREHPRREPVGGVHHRHDPRPGSGRAAARHRGQPGRGRRGRARDRRARRAPGQRHAARGGDRAMTARLREPGTRGVFPGDACPGPARRRLDAAVLGRRQGRPARRPAVHQLRHVPAAATAVLLRVPAPRVRVGRSCRARAPSTAFTVVRHPLRPQLARRWCRTCRGSSSSTAPRAPVPA